MAINVEEALACIYAASLPLSTEISPIENAIHRVLAQTVTAIHSLPAFDNSAMDGYAIRTSDAGKTLPQSCVIFAGDVNDVRLTEDQCIRIMTGSKIPDGCEAIVPIEEVIINGSNVTFPSKIKPAQHIRLKGEDIQAGMILLEKGAFLNAHHITLLASQGITHVQLY
ncbi:MAG: molybdopterin molybdenumtransferase MoeA, partial [Sulfuricurvum sp.]|nr:molybdopterin molybdenumtransferase MoeA [Sulfuricurvum sp.]